MSESLKRVLLVEDDKVDQMAFKRMVKQHKLPYSYTIAASAAEARKVLTAGHEFDVIIMDFHLGDGTAFDTLDSFASQEAPVIIATGTGDEETAVKALKLGAYDYLIKDPERNYLKVLASTAENAIKRKQIDQQVRMLSHAVMSATDSIYITDKTGLITFVNKAFCQTYGYDEAEILGRSRDILDPDQPRETVGKIPARAQIEEEVYHRRKDGSRFPVSLSRSVIKNEQGLEISFVTVAHDITERKQIEDQLRQLNATKDTFFSIISHDLRAPIAHFLGFSDILREQFDELSQDETKEFIGTINQSAKRLYDLLENLLQWSRVQTDKIETHPKIIDLKELIQTNIELLKGNADKKKIDLIFDDAENCSAYADHNMINSTVQNLISNAIKFTNRGGQIKISLADHEDFVDISVADTGVGMTQEIVKKLFHVDQHFTTYGTAEEKGSGLGLILCKEFIERNGGQISVESTPGQGSTFTISLPPPASSQLSA